MDKCNIFKPLSSKTGEFIMFSQYTEDITKEAPNKSTYRVVPSKFVAMELDLNDFDGIDAKPSISKDGSNISMEWTSGEKISGLDTIIPQIFQSYYENSVSEARNIIQAGDAENIFTADGTEVEYASELLWSCLRRLHLIHDIPFPNNEQTKTFEEVKYIGDINIHSDHTLDTYHYNEIFCYIPSEADEYYYPLISRGVQTFEVASDQNISGWNAASYPQGYPLCIKNIVSTKTGTEGYVLGDFVPDYTSVDFLENTNDHFVPIPRNADEQGRLKENVEYNINAILVLYDVYQNEPGEDPVLLHRNRPMGMYFTGPTETVEKKAEGDVIYNFISYIDNIDYGQGTVKVLVQEDDWTQVEVLTNNPDPEESWIGRTFWVNASSAQAGVKYELYDAKEGTALPDILVSVSRDDDNIEFQFTNTFTKYVSNNDAFGQGSSFGLRIMTRYIPTPNSSTYTMEVSTESGDYETIAKAMGMIADVIVSINRSTKEVRDMNQAYKDHLAMFKNYRVNVPYPRMVDGQYYWFINGRNTGQPCTIKNNE